MEHLSLKIHGVVQGVSFRYYARQKGEELGLAGWVKNNEEGTVSLVAEGERMSLKKLLEWCREGSPSARIEEIEEKWSDQVEGLEGFKIRK